MRQDLKYLITASSIVRLLLIIGVFMVNILSLMRLIFTSSKNFLSSFCVHRSTIAAILASNIVYLCTWLPYMFSFHQTGHWPFLHQREHCIIQYTISGQVMSILLAVLAIRKLYDCFSPSKARILAFAMVIAWLIPQAIYLNMIDLINNEKSSHQFLDRLLFTTNKRNGKDNDSPHNSIGFMMCIQKLASPIISQLSWHYIVLVIPLTTIILLCSVGHVLNKNKIHVSSCECLDDFAVSLSLYFNMMWLILLRPLIVLQTLMMSNEPDGNPPTYLDFGTHLVLIFASLAIPFSNSGGFRSISPNQSSSSTSLSATNSCCDRSSQSSVSSKFNHQRQNDHQHSHRTFHSSVRY